MVIIDVARDNPQPRLQMTYCHAARFRDYNEWAKELLIFESLNSSKILEEERCGKRSFLRLRYSPAFIEI